ncbi:MAG: hypothetical protein WAM60_12035 [Candidatus Promineifilaceae bacterium]
MSIHNVWQGKLVRLRGVEAEDWEVFCGWSLDTEFDRLSYNLVLPPAKAY